MGKGAFGGIVARCEQYGRPAMAFRRHRYVLELLHDVLFHSNAWLFMFGLKLH